MTLPRKDAAATSLSGFLATHEAWNVPLIGDSHELGWQALPGKPGPGNGRIVVMNADGSASDCSSS